MVKNVNIKSQLLTLNTLSGRSGWQLPLQEIPRCKQWPRENLNRDGYGDYYFSLQSLNSARCYNNLDQARSQAVDHMPSVHLGVMLLC